MVLYENYLECVSTKERLAALAGNSVEVVAEGAVSADVTALVLQLETRSRRRRAIHTGRLGAKLVMAIETGSSQLVHDADRQQVNVTHRPLITSSASTLLIPAITNSSDFTSCLSNRC